MATPQILADFSTQLSTAIAVGGTTGAIALNIDDDGVTVPDGLFYFTIDGNNSSKEYISCTKTGTSLTAIKTVSRQGVEVSGAARAHRVGASVVMTDFATYKVYMDQLTINGAADSSTSTKGIVKLSTAPVVPTEPIVVGDNDTRLPSQAENDALAGTSGTPSSSNKFVTASGLNNIKFGGNGSDGPLTISSGTTTINLGGASFVVKNYSNVSITGTAKLAFSNPHANGTIVVIKSQGIVTITTSTSPAIDLTLMGASGDTDGYSNLVFKTNKGGSSSTAAGIGGVALGTMIGLSSLKAVPLFCGAGGGASQVNAGSNSSYPGGGGASVINAGTNGSGSYTNDGVTNSGKRGGGALYIECAGTYTCSSTLSTAGTAGVGGDGGTGGGAGGSMVILYNTLGSDTGTYTVSGGTGGTGTSRTGGNGGAGYSFIGLNTEFA